MNSSGEALSVSWLWPGTDSQTISGAGPRSQKSRFFLPMVRLHVSTATSLTSASTRHHQHGDVSMLSNFFDIVASAHLSILQELDNFRHVADE